MKAHDVISEALPSEIYIAVDQSFLYTILPEYEPIRTCLFNESLRSSQ